MPRLPNGLLASNLMNIGAAGVFTGLEYNSRKSKGESDSSALAKSAVTNLLPALMFTGPHAFLYQTLYQSLPMLPAVVSGVQELSRSTSSYVRNSALPFSTYGKAPSAGAIDSLRNGMSRLNNTGRLTSIHSSLASQALRR